MLAAAAVVPTPEVAYSQAVVFDVVTLTLVSGSAYTCIPEGRSTWTSVVDHLANSTGGNMVYAIRWQHGFARHLCAHNGLVQELKAKYETIAKHQEVLHAAATLCRVRPLENPASYLMLTK